MESMEFNELKELIELFSKSEISKLEMSQEGLDLKLMKERAKVVAATEVAAALPAAVAVGAGADVEPVATEGVAYTTSPIVGTYYRAPNPKADPFIEIGDRVTKGQTLCIVEAMKLMNEIQAEDSGVVAEILVENGQGVEFGQKLVGVKMA